MKIIELRAENYKRLKVVEIRPGANPVVQITGKNGNGKTSVLDAIWIACKGLSGGPVKPIRTGQEMATIRIDLGELVVTRLFKRGKDGEVTSSLRVENAEGMRANSPQEVLDGLIGTLTFDPLAFSRMSDKEQFNLLRSFVSGYDWDGHDRAQADDYNRRTGINRRAAAALAAAKALQVREVSALIDEAALVAALEEAGKHNTGIETRLRNRDRLSIELQGMRNDIANGEERIKGWQAEISDIQAKISQETVRLEGVRTTYQSNTERLNAAPALPEPIDTAKLREEIAAARAHNAAVEEASNSNRERTRRMEEAETLEAESAAITAAMQGRDDAKRSAIAAAKLPVAGMDFGDGMLLLHGEPFSQASDAERLTASIAMAIALNENKGAKRLEVIRIRDGSLLDDDSMRTLEEMARAHSYQIWIERVDSSGKVGVVMEDGTVKQQET